MNILVVGGKGFVGTNLVKYLEEKEFVNKIYVFDVGLEGSNNYLYNTGKIELLDFNENTMNYKLFVQQLMKHYKIDRVVHLGSLSHVDTSNENPSLFIRWNVEKFLEFIEELNPEIPLLHFSTDEVFGSLKDGLSINEFGEIIGHEEVESNYQNFEPTSPYSSSKAMQEIIIEMYKKNNENFKITILTSTNIFGKFQDDKKFIPTIIRNMVKGFPIPIYPNGEQKRTWVYVGDVCKVVEKWLQIKNKEKIPSNLNVTNKDNEVTNLDLVKIIAKILNKDYTIKFIDNRKNHDYRYSLNNSWSINFLKYNPNTSLEYGLKQIILFYLGKYDII